MHMLSVHYFEKTGGISVHMCVRMYIYICRDIYICVCIYLVYIALFKEKHLLNLPAEIVLEKGFLQNINEIPAVSSFVFLQSGSQQWFALKTNIWFFFFYDCVSGKIILVRLLQASLAFLFALLMERQWRW